MIAVSTLIERVRDAGLYPSGAEREAKAANGIPPITDSERAAARELYAIAEKFSVLSLEQASPDERARLAELANAFGARGRSITFERLIVDSCRSLTAHWRPPPQPSHLELDLRRRGY